MTASLVQPLFDGPLDIVGDVHGEIEALRNLMDRLGYDQDGSHPDQRRLVFVGDLTDRGPDSPAVVELVQILIESGRAQCVLGNHDLNILLDRRKRENKWFYAEEFLDKDGSVVPQRLADDLTRKRVCRFFRTLPLALEREDLRVVHACWHDEMVAVAREATDAVSLYQNYVDLIKKILASQNQLDDIDIGLKYQNGNPVKRLTSGPEERTATPENTGGKLRNERRVIWWNDYRDPAFCVVGHYSLPDGESRGNGSAFCVDFGVGNRWMERRVGFNEGFSGKLAAMRFPEREVVFDEGENRP